MKALGAGNLAVAVVFFAEATLLALFGGVVGFVGGALLARLIGRSIFASQISIQPVLLPVILDASRCWLLLPGVRPPSGVRLI